MSTTKEVITDTACISVQILQTPGHVSSTVSNGTNPGNCDVAVRYPQDSRPVLIRCIRVLPTIGHSGSLEVLNKRQSISPSVRRNTKKFDASVHKKLADDRDSTSILGKALGQELSDSLSANIYLQCWMDFTSNAVRKLGTKFREFGTPGHQHIG